MYIFNLACIAERSSENILREWLRNEVLPSLESLPGAPALAAVVEVAEIENQPSFAEEALNLALQFEFDTLQNARQWEAAILPSLRQNAFSRFGEGLMLFPTILIRKDCL